MCNSNSEPEKVRQRYERRKHTVEANRYNFLNPAVWQSTQERQRAILLLLKRLGYRDLGEIRLLEIGCGSGSNLLEFLRFGFRPENLHGLELLDDRVNEAARLLPKGMVELGDACKAKIEEYSQDIVLQSVVFSSLLDEAFQQELANKMWSWVRPGGGVLWYDFTYNNPKNSDVRGMPVRRIKQLFPEGELRLKRLTLAPPIARRVTAVHPAFYRIFNALPFLRTHVLCWIGKPCDRSDRRNAQSHSVR